MNLPPISMTPAPYKLKLSKDMPSEDSKAWRLLLEKAANNEEASQKKKPVTMGYQAGFGSFGG